MTPTTACRIEKMPDGGYVVFEATTEMIRQGYFTGALFASTDIDAALAYIKSKITNAAD